LRRATTATGSVAEAMMPMSQGTQKVHEGGARAYMQRAVRPLAMIIAGKARRRICRICLRKMPISTPKHADLHGSVPRGRWAVGSGHCLGEVGGVLEPCGGDSKRARRKTLGVR
jgi:hypothetical protein